MRRRRASLGVAVLLLLSLIDPLPTSAQGAPNCFSTTPTILGSDADDPSLKGTPGDDVIVGLGGADVIDGMGGKDLICGGSGGDWIDGGGGIDSLSGEDGDDTLIGGPDGDFADGGAGADALEGQGGDDDLYGGSDADLVSGSAGDDELGDAGRGDDHLLGGKGNDLLEFFGPEVSVLEGGPGTDSLRGTVGAPDLYGGSGNDTLVAGLQGGNLRGGSGNDVMSSIGTGVAVRAGSGDDTFTGSEDAQGEPGSLDDPADVVVGGPGEDILEGGTGNDNLRGGPGTDNISGGANQDELYGDDAKDILSGGPDEDEFHGGLGDDEIIAAEGRDMVYGDKGADDVIGASEGTTAQLGPGNDEFLGADVDPDDENIDYISGQAGDDKIFGGLGADFLQGGDDQDVVGGERGDDQIFGDPGRDRLSGGDGIDTCAGGSDHDICDGGTPGPREPSPEDPDICEDDVETQFSCWEPPCPETSGEGCQADANGSLTNQRSSSSNGQHGSSYESSLTFTLTIALDSDDGSYYEDAGSTYTLDMHVRDEAYDGFICDNGAPRGQITEYSVSGSGNFSEADGPQVYGFRSDEEFSVHLEGLTGEVSGSRQYPCNPEANEDLGGRQEVNVGCDADNYFTLLADSEPGSYSMDCSMVLGPNTYTATGSISIVDAAPALGRKGRKAAYDRRIIR